MNKKEITNLVSGEVENYKKKTLDLNPSYASTQPDLLKLIDYYYASKFRDGDLDALGFRKVFYNICILPVEVAAKMMNIDTKNITLLGEDWDNYWTSWIKGKELHQWMENKYFGRQLNLYPLFMAKYGSLIVKKVGDDVLIPDINNIIFRPDSRNFEETPIIEKHTCSRDAFRVEAEKKGWTGYKKELAQLKKTDKNVEFYEVYFPEGFIESKYNYFLLGNEVIDYMEMDYCPYKKLDWEQVPGRGLGRGQVEKLLEDQIYLNRIANYKAEGLHWSSKHIFQSRDQNIVSNLLTNTENGDVLTVNSELTPVAMEERNLGFYRYDEIRWEQMAFRKSFTTEPITGERAPSGTPLGSSVLQAQMTKGYYDQKREDLGSFIEEILWDWVLPSFEKENAGEHEILIQNLITGSDDYGQKLFSMMVDDRLSKRKRDMLTKGKMLTRDEEMIIRGTISELLKREKIKIPRNSYKNLKHKIDIVITSENIDIPAKLTTLQVLMQVLGSNLAVMQDKRVRKILMKALDYSGFNPNEFDFGEEEQPNLIQSIQNARATRGGSVASAPFGGNVPTTMPQTI